MLNSIAALALTDPVAPHTPSAVIRLLAISLLRSWYPADSSAGALLEQPTRWAVDERELQLVTGLIGVAVGTSASASGPMTPRAGGTLAATAAGTPRLQAAAATPRAGGEPATEPG